MTEELEFNFDDFFVTQDPKQSGTVVQVDLEDVNGNTRTVPITIKRGLSFGDQEAAKQNAVKKRIKPNGEVEILDINEDIFAVEIVARAVKDWPFKYSDGKKVPVTRENVKFLLAGGVATLATLLINKISAGKGAKQPFTTPLGKSSEDRS